MSTKEPILYDNLCYLWRKRSEGFELLMINKNRPDFQQGMWMVPGGNNNPGERSIDGVAREFYEEIGLKLINPVFRGNILFDNRDRDFNDGKPQISHLVDVYECYEYSGHEKPEKGLRHRWVPTGEIKNLSMWPGDYELLKWIDVKFRGVFFGVQRYNGKELTHSQADFILPDGKKIKFSNDKIVG
jgi:ADP-ribose pyrophosphatase YjhB (NUDIX family)